MLATGFGNVAQYNQYAYCFNNPVSYQDDEGDFPQFLAGAVFGAGIVQGDIYNMLAKI